MEGRIQEEGRAACPQIIAKVKTEDERKKKIVAEKIFLTNSYI